MEARIARLESDVAHLCTDVADIKLDVRSLRDKVDLLGTKLSENTEKLVEMKGSFESSIASAKTWTLLIMIGFGTTILGAMARGFGWI